MAWICLVESEVCRLPFKIGLDHSLIAKSTNIVREFCSIEWQKGKLPQLQYAMTLEDSLGIKLKHYATSSMGDSLARISALQDAEKAWKDSEAFFIKRSCAWPKKSSPNSYFLKTSQQFAPEWGYKSLEKLPKWGMIVDGVLYPL